MKWCFKTCVCVCVFELYCKYETALRVASVEKRKTLTQYGIESLTVWPGLYNCILKITINKIPIYCCKRKIQYVSPSTDKLFRAMQRSSDIQGFHGNSVCNTLYDFSRFQIRHHFQFLSFFFQTWQLGDFGWNINLHKPIIVYCLLSVQ